MRKPTRAIWARSGFFSLTLWTSRSDVYFLMEVAIMSKRRRWRGLEKNYDIKEMSREDRAKVGKKVRAG